MAGESARSAACRGVGGLYDGFSDQRVAAYDDGLFAKRKNTGAAVVVFPGGGYQGLAIDLEGTEVCDWLTPKGITCVLLKYRVTDVGPYPKSGPYPESPMALEDAQRTVGLMRYRAASGTSIRTRMECLDFRQAVICRQR
jgi:hypothetical protein